VEVVQHQARRSGINPDYANPNLMHEARREYQTPRALSSEPFICNHRFYINHLDMLKHKTVRERGSWMNFKGKFNLSAEAIITNGEGEEQE